MLTNLTYYKVIIMRALELESKQMLKMPYFGTNTQIQTDKVENKN